MRSWDGWDGTVPQISKLLSHERSVDTAVPVVPRMNPAAKKRLLAS
jgi:hypothetical protein